MIHSSWRSTTVRVAFAGFILFHLVATIRESHGETLIDDFADGNDAGWTRYDATIGLSYGPGSFSVSGGAYHLVGGGPVPTGEIGNMASFWTASSAPPYSEGYLRGKIKVETNTVAYLILRGDTVANNYYIFGVDPSGEPPSFFFNRIESLNVAAYEPVDVPGEVVDIGEEWNIEAGLVGNQLSMKVWKPGQPVPAKPQWTRIDSTLKKGRFGVGASHWAIQPPSKVSASFDDIYFTPVPEPSGMLLTLLAIGITVTGRRRSIVRRLVA